MYMNFLNILNTRDLGLDVNIGCFFFYYLTDKCRSNVPLDALPALRRTPPVREIKHMATGARKTIEVIIEFRKCNKNEGNVGSALVGKVTPRILMQ